MYRVKTSVLFSTLWLLLLVSLAVAADGLADDATSEEPESAEVVEIRAERLSQASPLPSSLVTVIDIEDLGPGLVTTATITRAAPSVRLREFGGPGQMVTIGLRGAAAHQTLVQIAGVPIPDATGMGVDLAALPADLFGKVINRISGALFTKFTKLGKIFTNLSRRNAQSFT